MKKLLVLAVAVLGIGAGPAHAAEAQRRLELTPYVGGYVGLGDQRDALDDGLLLGLRLAYDLHPYVAVVGSFSWTPTQAIAYADEDLDLYQYDVGLQGQYPLALGAGWTLKPFVGVGVGARTYSFRDLDVSSETDFAWYGALGANVERGPLVAGLTARHQMSAFDGLAGEEDSTVRHDLGLFGSVGVRF